MVLPRSRSMTRPGGSRCFCGVLRRCPWQSNQRNPSPNYKSTKVALVFGSESMSKVVILIWRSNDNLRRRVQESQACGSGVPCAGEFRTPKLWTRSTHNPTIPTGAKWSWKLQDEVIPFPQPHIDNLRPLQTTPVPP